jgi:hypothetical protein
MADEPYPDTPRNLGDRDAPHTTPITPGEDLRTIMINRVAWGAVFAGTVLALATQIILNMLGIGIGAATLHPGSGANPAASTFSIGAGIWFAVSAIIATFIGAYASGRLAGKPKESTAGWHGLTTWALSTLVIFYLLTTTIGSIVGGTLSSLGSVAGTVGQTAAQVAGQPGRPDPFSAIQQALQSSGADAAAISAMRAALTGDQAQTDQAREQAAQALAKSRNIPIDQARNQVSQYQQQFQSAAQSVANTTATATSTGALLGAVTLILGAIAGWFGGRAGAVDPTMTAGTGVPLPGRPSRVGEPVGTTARGAGGPSRPEQRPH